MCVSVYLCIFVWPSRPEISYPHSPRLCLKPLFRIIDPGGPLALKNYHVTWILSAYLLDCLVFSFLFPTQTHTRTQARTYTHTLSLSLSLFSLSFFLFRTLIRIFSPLASRSFRWQNFLISLSNPLPIRIFFLSLSPFPPHLLFCLSLSLFLIFFTLHLLYFIWFFYPFLFSIFFCICHPFNLSLSLSLSLFLSPSVSLPLFVCIEKPYSLFRLSRIIGFFLF